MRRTLLPSLLCLFLIHCGSQSKSNAPEEIPKQEHLANQTQEQVSNASVEMLFDAAGYGGAIGIAIWPNRWGDLVQLSEALRENLPEEMHPFVAGAQAQFAGEDGPWPLLNLLALNVGIEGLPPTLPGIDKSRPIVASLLRPMTDFEFLAQKLAAGEQPAAAGIHSRIVLPTDDSHATSAAIADALGKMKLTKEDGGAHTTILRNDELVVRLQAAKLWLEVDVVIGMHLASLPLASLDEGASKTAADSVFSRSDTSIARVQLRNAEMEQSGAFMGMRNVSIALESASKAYRMPMLMEGYSEVLSMPALMDPRGRSSSDTIFEISGGTQAQLRGMFVLSEAGTKAWSAALPDEKPVSPQTLDWLAVLKAAPMPPALAKLTTRKAVELPYMAGYAAFLYIAGANAITFGQLYANEAGVKNSGEVLDAMGPVQGFKDAMLHRHGNLLVLDMLGNAAPSPTLGPIPAATRMSVAEGCYRDAQNGLRLGFGALGAVDAKMRPALIQALAKEVDESLRCAAQSDDFQPRVEAVRATLKSLK